MPGRFPLSIFLGLLRPLCSPFKLRGHKPHQCGRSDGFDYWTLHQRHCNRRLSARAFAEIAIPSSIQKLVASKLSLCTLYVIMQLLNANTNSSPNTRLQQSVQSTPPSSKECSTALPLSRPSLDDNQLLDTPGLKATTTRYRVNVSA